MVGTFERVCDCLCALPPATAAAGALFAKNSDRPPTEPQALEWHPPRRDTGPVRATHIEIEAADRETIGFVGSRPIWMWGVEHGVNEAGLAAGNETIYTTLDPRPFPPALLGMDLVRLALERATTARDGADVVLDHLERYGQGGTGHRDGDRPYWSSLLLCDATSALVIETSGRVAAVEWVDRTRAISNRTTIAAFDTEHRHPGQPVESLVDPRLDASRAVLAREPVSVDGLRRHLRSHVGGDDGWTVCMHVDGVEATTASVVATLGTRPVGRFLLGSPCRSVYVPVTIGPLGDLPQWERFANLMPADRGALDELERDLDADVSDALDWNVEACRRVAAVLDRLVPSLD